MNKINKREVLEVIEGAKKCNSEKINSLINLIKENETLDLV